MMEKKKADIVIPEISTVQASSESKDAKNVQTDANKKIAHNDESTSTSNSLKSEPPL
jgi:hypothetical protein